VKKFFLSALLLAVFALSTSMNTTQASTQGNCLKSLKTSLQNSKANLVDEKSVRLEKGQDSMALGGEIYNDTNIAVDVYFISESNGYYSVYTALLLDPVSCKIVAKEPLGDDA
jgi:hypothetical protein